MIGNRQRSRIVAPLLFAVSALAGPAGCALRAKSVPQTPFPGLGYERSFPRHVEVCAVSQIPSNFAPRGGTPGLAVMYLKGACPDAGAGYARLKLCDPATADFAAGETGTGVSVNKVLKNVNWLAVPGRSLFFRGNLGPDELPDAPRAVATVLEARDRGVFRGVEAHEKFLPPQDDERLRPHFAGAETLGTDFPRWGPSGAPLRRNAARGITPPRRRLPAARRRCDPRSRRT